MSDIRKEVLKHVQGLAKQLKAKDTRFRHGMRGDPDVDSLMDELLKPEEPAPAEAPEPQPEPKKLDVSALTPEAIKGLVESLKK